MPPSTLLIFLYVVVPLRRIWEKEKIVLYRIRERKCWFWKETKYLKLIPTETGNNKELENLIEGAKDNYYPMMDSDEIDNLVTNIVIEKYGLKAYDLNIVYLIEYLYMIIDCLLINFDML